MKRELSVLAAAYSDSEDAERDFEGLKEDLPTSGRLMDRSKVVVLASSDAPNEVTVEHTGGGPIGKLVEVRAARTLKGRLAPGNAMVIGVMSIRSAVWTWDQPRAARNSRIDRRSVGR